MDNGQTDETVFVPEQRGIQTQIEAIFAPISQSRLNQGLVESMDVEARIVEPAADSPLFALGVLTSAGDVRQPAGKVAFTPLQ